MTRGTFTPYPVHFVLRSGFAPCRPFHNHPFPKSHCSIWPRENGPRLAEVHDRYQEIFETGRFVHGAECRTLEEKIAKLCDVPYAVGCASGSDALLLALMALDVGPGDEVIVPSFTFFATASAVSRLGAKPVFADIDPRTFNLDPADVAERITSATRVIIPVHLFGQCADMTAFRRLAETHSIHLVEDAAQAIGATYHGQPAGSLGTIGCFSFYPTKNLGGCGDGGMTSTADKQIADRIDLLRGHGMRPRYYHHAIGINSRLDTLQAAFLLAKLPYLSEMTTARRQNANWYQQAFADAAFDDRLVLPQQDCNAGHVWNQFTVRIRHGERDALRTHLQSRGVGSEIYYPVPLHQQPCFRALGMSVRGLPRTEEAAGEVLSLPIFPGLTEAELQYVVDSVSEFFRSAYRRIAA